MRRSAPIAAIVAGWAFAGAADAPPPALGLPIACEVGKTCFVQQYRDHDPGPGAKDYRCGGRVYDGHDGVDIRLPSIAAQRRGVAVLAAAAGVVEGMRDGMADAIRDRGDLASIKDRECGNGVLIRHGGGWRTQYCHLAQGSIVVKSGQPVAAGAKLGLVGLSGDTQFPHLHLAVRHDAEKVDPFAPALKPGACGANGGKALWSAAAATALAYRSTEIVNAGFAAAPVDADAIEREAIAAPGRSSAALVFYARAIGLQAGDVVRLTVRRPDGGEFVSDETAVDRAKAQWLAFAGRKRPPEGWAAGRYTASCRIVRNGKIAAETTAILAM